MISFFPKIMKLNNHPKPLSNTHYGLQISHPPSYRAGKRNR